MRSTITSDDALRMWRRAKAPRDRALLVLLWRAGLRCAEACAAKPADLQTGGGKAKLLVPLGKGGKSRVVGLDARSAETLRTLSDRPTFLATRTGSPMMTSHARRRIPQLAKSAGVGPRVHPHALRHLFACELYREGVRVREIQLLLGHASVATTQIYLEGLGASEAVDASAGRAW